MMIIIIISYDSIGTCAHVLSTYHYTKLLSSLKNILSEMVTMVELRLLCRNRQCLGYEYLSLKSEWSRSAREPKVCDLLCCYICCWSRKLNMQNNEDFFKIPKQISNEQKNKTFTWLRGAKSPLRRVGSLGLTKKPLGDGDIIIRIRQLVIVMAITLLMIILIIIIIIIIIVSIIMTHLPVCLGPAPWIRPRRRGAVARHASRVIRMRRIRACRRGGRHVGR